MLKYLFIDHKTRQVSSGTGIKLPDKSKGCIWVYLSAPTENEKSLISQEFGVDTSCIKNYTREARSKRYSLSPLIFVMVDYFVESNAIKKTNILVIIKKDVFITVFPESHKQLEEIFNDIVEYISTRTKKDRNVGEIIYEFIDRDVQDNYDVLKLTEEKIAHLEKSILVKDKPDNIGDVIELKKELFAMSRRFWATAKIVFLLKKGLVSVDISKRTENLLIDVYDSFQHQIEVLEIQRELLSDALTLYEATLSNKLAGISNDLNIAMKRLTAFTVILLFPSLIAGMFGMNFKHLPLTESPAGFWAILGIMIILSGLMYVLFHKNRWI